MTLRAFIFDLDGTLVDNNMAHVEAWRRAFAKFGTELSRAMIEPQIGQGGELIVQALIGDEAEQHLGDGIRAAQARAYLAIAHQIRFPVFPGVLQLLSELRRRGVATAVATSSGPEQLQATLESARLQLEVMVDVIVDASATERTKPHPDLLEAALKRLDRLPGEAVFIGDTRYDGEASRAAGIRFIGLTAGGSTQRDLLAAGAIAVFSEPGDLVRHLDNIVSGAPLEATSEASG